MVSCSNFFLLGIECYIMYRVDILLSQDEKYATLTIFGICKYVTVLLCQICTYDAKLEGRMMHVEG